MKAIEGRQKPAAGILYPILYTGNVRGSFVCIIIDGLKSESTCQAKFHSIRGTRNSSAKGSKTFMMTNVYHNFVL